MSTEASVKKLTFKLLLAAVGMFGFAVFVMPPLYDVFCEITGLGGKTSGPYVAEQAAIDTTRKVRVQFVTTNNGTMPWAFKPQIHEVEVHPGEPMEVSFFAENGTSQDMVAQAVPSVSPFSAADYFHKTECFCFNNQPLAAGEQADLPLLFVVDQELPKAIKTITLSYTLFDITGRLDSEVAKLNE